MNTLFKRLGITALAAMALYSASMTQRAAFAADTKPVAGPMIAEGEAVEEDAFGGIAHTTFYHIKSVKLDPPAPKAGQKAKVTAVLELASDEEENSIKDAKVYVTSGGKNVGSPLKVAMSGEGGKKATLTGEITAGKGKNQVWVWAKDMYGNVSTQAPKMDGTWPPKKEQMIPGGSDIDNASDIVPDDMDVLDTAVGHDDKYFYTYFKVQGKISGGSVDEPVSIHLYGTKMSNPDVEEGEGLLIGKVIAHAPLAPVIAEKFKDKLKEAGIDIQIPEFAILDLQKVMEDPKSGFKMGVGEKMHKKDGEFYGAVPLDFLGKNPSTIIRSISLGIANASVEALVPIPYNCSHFTILHRATVDFNG